MVGRFLAEDEDAARVGESQDSGEHGPYALKQAHPHRRFQDEEGQGELEQEPAAYDPVVDLPVAVSNQPCKSHDDHQSQKGDPTFQSGLLLRILLVATLLGRPDSNRPVSV